MKMSVSSLDVEMTDTPDLSSYSFIVFLLTLLYSLTFEEPFVPKRLTVHHHISVINFSPVISEPVSCWMGSSASLLNPSVTQTDSGLDPIVPGHKISPFSPTGVRSPGSDLVSTLTAVPLFASASSLLHVKSILDRNFNCGH